MTRHIAIFGKTGKKHADIVRQGFAGRDNWQIDTWPCNDDMAARDKIIAACEIAVISPDFLLTQGNFSALMSGSKLKLFIQPWVGTDWIDPGFLPKGLQVCNASGHAAPMAEFVLGTMLEHALELRAHHGDMHAGRWHRSGRNNAAEALHSDLADKTLAIIGYGEIAQAVAARATVFGMTVIAVARTPRDAIPAPLSWMGVQADLPKLLAEADYLVLTCDLNEDTEGMMDAAAFKKMKPTAYLVNVARGEVINEDALYDALKNHTIAGAALDTWYRYPANVLDAEPDPDRGGAYQGSKHDFLVLNNVLLTPHCAANTHGADRGRYESIAETLLEYADGKQPKRYVLTGTGTNPDGFTMA